MLLTIIYIIKTLKSLIVNNKEAENILNQNGFLIEKNYGINTPVWKPGTDALYNALKKYKNYDRQKLFEIF